MASIFTAVGYSNSVAIVSPYPHPIVVPFKFYTGGTASTAGLNDATHTPLGTSGLFVVGDTVRLVRLPKGATIDSIWLDMPDVDSGTSSTTSLGLVTGGGTLFLSSSTAGQAGAKSEISGLNGYVAGSLPYIELTVDDILVLTATLAGAGAGTSTAATAIRGWVMYHCNPSTVF